MGDRFSFGVTDRGGDVLYLYSHWGGQMWDVQLKAALWEAGAHSKSSERANRIFMSQIVGASWDSKTGYAFSINNPTDTEYGYIPVVDFNNSTVTFYEYLQYPDNKLGDALLKLSIIEFMNVGDIFGLLHYAQQELDNAREDINVTV
jgi:hypothetical protein